MCFRKITPKNGKRKYNKKKSKPKFGLIFSKWAAMKITN